MAFHTVPGVPHQQPGPGLSTSSAWSAPGVPHHQPGPGATAFQHQPLLPEFHIISLVPVAFHIPLLQEFHNISLVPVAFHIPLLPEFHIISLVPVAFHISRSSTSSAWSRWRSTYPCSRSSTSSAWSRWRCLPGVPHHQPGHEGGPEAGLFGVIEQVAAGKIIVKTMQGSISELNIDDKSEIVFPPEKILRSRC